MRKNKSPLSDDVSSGYSTISNDNLPSPALYLPPPQGGAYNSSSELEAGEEEGGGEGHQEGEGEGGVSGWDDWRIMESEVTLGAVISSTENETVYRYHNSYSLVCCVGEKKTVPEIIKGMSARCS